MSAFRHAPGSRFLALSCLGILASAPSLAQGPDTDHDGIQDSVEHQLLERYRPYFAFAGNEDYRPTDVLFYLRYSELLARGDEGSTPLIGNAALRNSPNLVLTANIPGNDYCRGAAPDPITCVSNLVLNPRQTNYRINPLVHPPGGPAGDPGRHGADWSSIQQQGNVGLYGHVVPIRLNPDMVRSCHARWDTLPTPTERAQLFYKVEYWQFFGYNSQDVALIGDHEGDWVTVQLLVRPAALDFSTLGQVRLASPEAIVAVMMYAHGLEFRYDLGPGDAHSVVAGFEEHHGPNFGRSVDIALQGHQCDSAVVNAQDNFLRLFRDPATQRFTHPVAYIERGGHEAWPTTGWSYRYAQSHDGHGLNILTATPPNLGEVEAPMTEYSGALPILRFNGLWGAFSRLNTPPPGPPLHAQWTYPANSSIGWLLPHRPY